MELSWALVSRSRRQQYYLFSTSSLTLLTWRRTVRGSIN